MEKILTISIAAYNVEQYLNDALDSLINESILDDLEIFVVDDGSKDKTLEIAKNYADRYPNIIFSIHKENGGYGSTINTSIKLATGKYFKQLDGDDWFFKENLPEFIDVLKKTDADLVTSQVLLVNEKEKTQKIRDDYLYIDEGQYNFDTLELKEVVTMHSSAFKTSILKDNDIKLSENCFYTDIEYTNYVVPYLNDIFVWHGLIYCYRLGRDGQSVSIESLKKHYKDHQIVLSNMIDTYNSVDVNLSTKRNVIMLRLANMISQQFKIFCYFPLSNGTYNEICKFYRKLKTDYPEILKITSEKKIYVRLFSYFNCALYPLIKFLIFLETKRIFKTVKQLITETIK